MTKSILLLNPTAWVNLFVNIHMFCQIHPRALIWSLSTKIISSWIVVFTFFCILIVYIKCICKIELKNWIPPSPPHYMNGYFDTIRKLTLTCSIVQLNSSTGRNYLKIRMLMSSCTSSTKPCLILFIISFQISI